jgi:hypothetical protein
MTDTRNPRLVATPCGAIREARLKEAAATLMGIVRDEEGARERLLALDATLARRADLQPVATRTTSSQSSRSDR